MADSTGVDEDRVKHLEMIQAVIGRLSNQGFLFKGWNVTIAAALLGFAVNRDKWQLAVAVVVPALLFWVLDGLFLRNERLFRELFNEVRKGVSTFGPFFMAATGPSFVDSVKASEDQKRKKIASWWRTLWQPTLWLFYGGTMALSGAAAVIIHCT